MPSRAPLMLQGGFIPQLLCPAPIFHAIQPKGKKEGKRCKQLILLNFLRIHTPDSVLNR